VRASWVLMAPQEESLRRVGRAVRDVRVWSALQSDAALARTKEGGTVTRYELRAALRRSGAQLEFEDVSVFLKWVAGPGTGDGASPLSLARVWSKLGALRQFERADINQDGVLTVEEFQRITSFDRGPEWGGARPGPSTSELVRDISRPFAARSPGSSTTDGEGAVDRFLALVSDAPPVLGQATTPREPPARLMKREQRETTPTAAAPGDGLAATVAHAERNRAERLEMQVAELHEALRRSEEQRVASEAEQRQRMMEQEQRQRAAAARAAPPPSPVPVAVAEAMHSADAEALRVRCASLEAQVMEQEEAIAAATAEKNSAIAAAVAAASSSHAEKEVEGASELMRAVTEAGFHERISELERLLALETEARVRAEAEATAARVKHESSSSAAAAPATEETAALEEEVAGLTAKLQAEAETRATVETELAEALARAPEDRSARLKAEEESLALRRELSALKAEFAAAVALNSSSAAPAPADPDSAAALVELNSALDEQRRTHELEVSDLREQLIAAKEEALAVKEQERVHTEQLMEREKRLLGTLMAQLQQSQSEQLRLDDYCAEMEKVYSQLETLYHSLKSGDPIAAASPGNKTKMVSADVSPNRAAATDAQVPRTLEFEEEGAAERAAEHEQVFNALVSLKQEMLAAMSDKA